MAGTSEDANANSSRTLMPNDLESWRYVPVTDGNSDVAETLDGDRIKVQAPGHLPMQRACLCKGSTDGKMSEKGLTNRPYDVKEDGPVMNPVGQLPSAQELLPGPNVVQYLEVNIVIGDDPPRFKPLPLINKKSRDNRKQRGDMPRHASAIRAFIHTTTTIASQAKFVIGVKPIDGYLNPRMIDSECIFSYPEFWKGIEKAAKKERKKPIHARVKQLATDTRVQAERTTAMTTAEEMASPDVDDGVHAATPGVKSFFNFNEALKLEDAASVVYELKIATSVIVGTVQVTHRLLREHEISDRLPYDDLALFLVLCNHNIPSIDVGDEVMVQEVKRALEMVKVYGKYKTR